MKKTKKPLCVRWPEELEQVANDYARKNEQTLSSLSRLAMRRFLEAEGVLPTALGGVVGRGDVLGESKGGEVPLADPHGANAQCG